MCLSPAPPAQDRSTGEKIGRWTRHRPDQHFLNCAAPSARGYSPNQYRHHDVRTAISACASSEEKCQSSTSVPILKFLCTMSLHVESSPAEASDRGEDIVCMLGPSERLGISISCVDICIDCSLQCFGGAMGSTLDLLLCEECEERSRCARRALP